jgi:hypothetical protein
LRNEGTQIDEEWYCGPECFEEAALMRFAQLYAHRDYYPLPRKPRMPLGLSALSLGHITPEQLHAALQYQQEHGGRIGEILVALGFENQAQVTAALSAQWGYPVLSLHGRELALDPMQRIPMRLVEIYSMLPVHFVARTNKLVVGFAQMVEHRILATIETMLRCTVIPCFLTPDDFESHYRALQTATAVMDDEVVFEQRATLQEIARTTRSYAWQIGANSARFGMCSEYLWSRLEGPRVSLDILSKI